MITDCDECPNPRKSDAICDFHKLTEYLREHPAPEPVMQALVAGLWEAAQFVVKTGSNVAASLLVVTLLLPMIGAYV